MKTTTKTTEAKGLCFVNSYKLLIDGSRYGNSVTKYIGTPKLVHGIVHHDDTGWHVHGWVEDMLFCYDFVGKELLRIAKHHYYRIGSIRQEPGYIFKYTVKEAMALASKENNYYFSNLPCDK